MVTQDATHPRKSRLTVPAGTTDATPPTATVSTAAAGGTPVLRSSSNGHNIGGGNNSRHAHYVARLMDVRQMDIQSALDQMKTLLSTRPQVVYKTSYYRKQTKNHWARDDPAFCVLQVIFLIIASIAYSVAFRTQVSGTIVFLLQSVLWNWLICGVILATLGREIANRHLTVHQSSSHVRQSVEWLYAFDIHCNAFVPLFVLLCKEILKFAMVIGLFRMMFFRLTFGFSFNRWGPILSVAFSLGQVAGGALDSQYIIRRCISLVLVHYSSWLPGSALFVQHGDFPLSHCGRCSGVPFEFDWISLWLWLERLSGHGSFVF